MLLLCHAREYYTTSNSTLSQDLHLIQRDPSLVVTRLLEFQLDFCEIGHRHSGTPGYRRGVGSRGESAVQSWTLVTSSEWMWGDLGVYCWPQRSRGCRSGGQTLYRLWRNQDVRRVGYSSIIRNDRIPCEVQIRLTHLKICRRLLSSGCILAPIINPNSTPLCSSGARVAT
jgi:hypothetical protein